MLSAFQNEPLTDFTLERNALLMREAIANLESQFGAEYPLIIGGKRYKTGDMLPSLNPSNYDEVVGLVHKANVEMADKAMDAATAAFKEWSKVPAAIRARYLLKAAALLRRR